MTSSSPVSFLGSSICPYCQRVELALADAALPYERVEVDFTNPTLEQRTLSPTGRFPILLTPDHVLFESGPIVEWINESRGGKYLPSSPAERSIVRGLCAVVDTTHQTLRAFFCARSEDSLIRSYESCLRELHTLEQLLGKAASERLVSSGGTQLFLSAFYLLPLALVCELLDSPEFPLISSFPNLHGTVSKLWGSCPASGLLRERRAPAAQFFLGIDSLLITRLNAKLVREAQGGKTPWSPLKRGQQYFSGA